MLPPPHLSLTPHPLLSPLLWILSQAHYPPFHSLPFPSLPSLLSLPSSLYYKTSRKIFTPLSPPRNSPINCSIISVLCSTRPVLTKVSSGLLLPRIMNGLVSLILPELPQQLTLWTSP